MIFILNPPTQLILKLILIMNPATNHREIMIAIASLAVSFIV